MKKNILYYIIYPSLEWNIDPILGKVKDVVEIFSFTTILIELQLNLEILEYLENLNFGPKLLTDLPQFLVSLNQNMSIFIGRVLVQFGYVSSLHLLMVSRFVTFI